MKIARRPASTAAETGEPLYARKAWISRLTKIAAICLLFGLAGTQAYANPNQDVCSNATLVGDYASTVGGQLFHSDGSVETRQGLVMSHFDGHGNFTQTDYVLNTLNGTTSATPGPIDPQTLFQNHESGTYQVNGDCTGKLEIHFAPPPVPGATGAVLKLLLVIGSHGNALRTVVISVTPPSIIPNDISGFTLHSEGSRLGEIQDK
jgi:hypothetical protein